MRVVAIGFAFALLAACAAPVEALDCARVQALHAEHKRASEIARALAVTTPEVQSCLAGEEQPAPQEQQRTGRLLAPSLPAGDSALPRPPNQ